MRYPNRRYGNPTEMAYFAIGYGDTGNSVANLAKSLRRDERTVRDWLNGKRKVPFWVPELMRLRDVERRQTLWQMGLHNEAKKFGVVRGDVLDLAVLRPKVQPSMTELRLDDFDAAPVAAVG